MLFFTSHGMLCFKKALLFSLVGKHIVRRGSESCGCKFQGGSYIYQKMYLEEALHLTPVEEYPAQNSVKLSVKARW